MKVNIHKKPTRLAQVFFLFYKFLTPNETRRPYSAQVCTRTGTNYYQNL